MNDKKTIEIQTYQKILLNLRAIYKSIHKDYLNQKALQTKDYTDFNIGVREGMRMAVLSTVGKLRELQQ